MPLHVPATPPLGSLAAMVDELCKVQVAPNYLLPTIYEARSRLTRRGAGSVVIQTMRALSNGANGFLGAVARKALDAALHFRS